jgi:succinate-acetate transporter protein
MSYAALFVNAFGFLGDYDTDTDQLHHSLGIFLLGWTIFSFLMLLASHRTTLALFTLFVVLEITFILLTIGAWTNSVRWTQAGGAFGILDAMIAWYCALAGIMTPSNSVIRLPVYELGPWWDSRAAGTQRLGKTAAPGPVLNRAGPHGFTHEQV